MLDFYAEWCSTCRRQKHLLQSLIQEEPFQDVVAFTVDYDNAKDLNRSLNVARQSTLIVFKGERETGRLIAVTDKDKMRTLASRARSGQSARRR